VSGVSSLFSRSSLFGSDILLSVPLTNITPHLNLRNDKLGKFIFIINRDLLLLVNAHTHRGD
jgi:hypothetical protein